MGLNFAIIGFAVWPDMPKTLSVNHAIKNHLRYTAYRDENNSQPSAIYRTFQPNGWPPTSLLGHMAFHRDSLDWLIAHYVLHNVITNTYVWRSFPYTTIAVVHNTDDHYPIVRQNPQNDRPNWIYPAICPCINDFLFPSLQESSLAL